VTEEIQAHKTRASMAKAGLAELDAGSAMALKVRIACSSACDLRGTIVKIITQDATVVEKIELVSFDEAANETDEFVVKAPTKPGKYTWTAVFAAQEKQGLLHEESSATFSFIVKPHTTSIAVWDVPSPIAFGHEFRIKVGVNCSAECRLTNQKIEIYDHEGVQVATGTLGASPWSATGALYWAEVELKAPGTAGLYTWTVKFPQPDLELAHEGAAYTFAFLTASPPEHVVTVEVIDQDAKTPIKDAYVLLHPYRGYSDECGVTKLYVPKGKYELQVLRHHYKDLQTTVEVASDLAVKAELLFDPVELDTA
jgi:hypothetical protein